MYNNSKYFLGTINKALSVLDLFKKHTTLGITDIARNLSIGKSNAFRLVITLEYWGYLEKTQEQKYRLGTTLAYLGNLVLERQEIIPIARPFLQKLKNTYDETTHLAILTPDIEVTFLVKEVAVHSIQMDSTIGLKMPAYATANGKVLLAFLEQSSIDDYLDNIHLIKKTEKTIVAKDELLQRLQQIRDNGYGIDDEESEIGLVCYAAPVRNMSGKVIASVSMSGPAFRMANNKEARVNAVKSIAEEISQNLGCV
jgi:DNA-binding IclR family transcriptional regulator